MKRRHFLWTAGVLGSGAVLGRLAGASAGQAAGNRIEKLVLSDAEWRKRLEPDRYRILRDAGTERPNSSALNAEKRAGTFVCAGCELPLFTSEMKYDSGTGWPSFFTTIEGAVETKLDFKLIYPRTEYHCARCEGHQGHLFKDGPKPTGQRWCNNGLALKFQPA
ncbi:MAG: peptide-methionine (R)-S-oxide reductase MsrB [Gammaproteobacteria bacterium]|nr:peptide-methionine (R)-S-oxide reductase MsrB [Gammaproteobacteria bacterium]